jgi:hypothetical protein
MESVNLPTVRVYGSRIASHKNYVEEQDVGCRRRQSLGEPLIQGSSKR